MRHNLTIPVEGVLLAALQNEPLRYTHMDVRGGSVSVDEFVIDFHESPGEVWELFDHPEIIALLGEIGADRYIEGDL